MAYETESWTYVPAKHIGPVRDGAVRVIVIHTAETTEAINAAEKLAQYGQHPDYVSSWHVTCDNDSIIQCVKDSRVAYAAPGCNHDGIQIELCCYMGQTISQWRDPYSLGLIALAADVTAQYCLKYGILPVQLTDTELLAGGKGIVGHHQVSRVYKKSDHTDPGPNFPWKRFLMLTSEMIVERRIVA